MQSCVTAIFCDLPYTENIIPILMTHYICTGGCMGVSQTPGVCMAPDCAKHSEHLLPCDCTDGLHYDQQSKTDREEGEEMEEE